MSHETETCPTCGSKKPEELRARTSTGRWISWWEGLHACKDKFHKPAEAPPAPSEDAERRELQDAKKAERLEYRVQVNEELVVEIARELYDRFMMGGWEPQDAYPQIRGWLARSRREAK